MSSTSNESPSFLGFQFLYAYPLMQGQKNPHVEQLHAQHYMTGFKIADLQKAMKEVVKRVKAAEKNDKQKFAGFVLNYEIGDAPQQTRRVYFVNKRTEFLPYSAANYLANYCEKAPSNNWMTSSILEQGKFIKTAMDQAPVGTSAFIRVKGDKYYLFPLRPEDIVVNRTRGEIYKI